MIAFCPNITQAIALGSGLAIVIVYDFLAMSIANQFLNLTQLFYLSSYYRSQQYWGSFQADC